MKKRMISYLRQGQTLGFVLMFLLFLVSCGESQYGQKIFSNQTASPPCTDSLPAPRSAFTIQDGPTTQVASEIARDVGKVIASGRGSTNRTIFVFEERHDSRITQMEIAIMLWRLQKTQSLRQISLEGAIAAKDDLPVSWFHNATASGEAKQAGREAALKLLREGEISAGEFIALAQPLVQVKGNEIQSEYDVTASQTNSTLGYLVGIAERSLNSTDAQRVNDLVKAEKIEEALDTLFSKDSWCRERYQKLLSDSPVSTEESVVVVREIEAKAKELGVQMDARQQAGLREDLNFYQTASKRSCTIVSNTLAMMDPARSAPVALIIGAAHTPKVVELIKAAKLNYVVLSPLSLVTPTKASRLTTPMYKRKMALRSIDGAGMLGAFLDGRKKLAPVSGKKWFQSKSAIFVSTDLIVAAAARGERVPSDTLKTQLQSFQPIKIDWSSIRLTGKGDQVRVTYKVAAQTSDSDPLQTVDIWVVGWHQPPPVGPFSHTPLSDDESDVEKFILAAIDEDRNKPALSQKEDPGPKPGEVAIVQLSTKTKAAFSTDPNLLQQVIVAR